MANSNDIAKAYAHAINVRGLGSWLAGPIEGRKIPDALDAKLAIENQDTATLADFLRANAAAPLGVEMAKRIADLLDGTGEWRLEFAHQGKKGAPTIGFYRGIMRDVAVYSIVETELEKGVSKTRAVEVAQDVLGLGERVVRNAYARVRRKLEN